MRTSRKLVHGVGVKGNTSVKINGKFKKAYTVWKAMLGRCYYYSNNIQPTYKDCSVCEEWLNFEVFEKWFNKNYIAGFDLDKDILKYNNKIYCPEYCRFIPSEVNRLFVQANLKNKETSGVTKQPRSNTYIARLSTSCKRVYLGAFKTREEAFACYKVAKEKHVKLIARKYYDSGMITKQMLNSLLGWRLT